MSSSRKRRLHYRRTFLNRPGFHAGAYAIASAERWDDDELGRSWVNADLTLADCSTVTVLDFSFSHDSSAASRRNVLHKVRVLREVVDAFADFLESELADR